MLISHVLTQNEKLKKECGLRFQLYHLLIYQTTDLRHIWALVFSSVKWCDNIAPYQRVVCEDETSYWIKSTESHS